MSTKTLISNISSNPGIDTVTWEGYDTCLKKLGESILEFFCLLFPAVTVGYQWLPNGSALYFGVKLHSDHDWSLAVTNGNHWKPLNKKTPLNVDG